VSLSVLTGFLAFAAVFPGAGHGSPASVTAGVAVEPQATQAATVAFHTAGTHGVPDAVTDAAPTLAGTAPVAPVPVPTPVP
jgi:hypothetical protein